MRYCNCLLKTKVHCHSEWKTLPVARVRTVSRTGWYAVDFYESAPCSLPFALEMSEYTITYHSYQCWKSPGHGNLKTNSLRSHILRLIFGIPLIRCAIELMSIRLTFPKLQIIYLYPHDKLFFGFINASLEPRAPFVSDEDPKKLASTMYNIV